VELGIGQLLTIDAPPPWRHRAAPDT
jgi:hypothetical protein